MPPRLSIPALDFSPIYSQRGRRGETPSPSNVPVSPSAPQSSSSSPAGGSSSPQRRTSPGLRTVNFAYSRGRLIGRGGFGAVYLSLNHSTGELMAMKRIQRPAGSLDDAASRSEFAALRRELEVVSKLRHPHVVGYLGVLSTPDELCLFMEYCPLGSLSDLLRDFGPLPTPVARNYGRQLLLGLAFLHHCGYAHRDVKGANVLVAEDVSRPPGVGSGGSSSSSAVGGGGVTVKLADFGSARDVFKAASDESARRGKKGAGPGTPNWEAPEVLRGEVETSAAWQKADIWSFGCVVVEMLTAEPPWSDLFPNGHAALLGIASGDVDLPLPPCLSAVGIDFLTSCIDRDSRQRLSAAHLLHHPFVKLEHSAPPTGDRLPQQPPPQSRPPQHAGAPPLTARGSLSSSSSSFSSAPSSQQQQHGTPPLHTPSSRRTPNAYDESPGGRDATVADQRSSPGPSPSQWSSSRGTPPVSPAVSQLGGGGGLLGGGRSPFLPPHLGAPLSARLLPKLPPASPPQKITPPASLVDVLSSQRASLLHAHVPLEPAPRSRGSSPSAPAPPRPSSDPHAAALVEALPLPVPGGSEVDLEAIRDERRQARRDRRRRREERRAAGVGRTDADRRDDPGSGHRGGHASSEASDAASCSPAVPAAGSGRRASHSLHLLDDDELLVSVEKKRMSKSQSPSVRPWGGPVSSDVKPLANEHVVREAFASEQQSFMSRISSSDPSRESRSQFVADVARASRERSSTPPAIAPLAPKESPRIKSFRNKFPSAAGHQPTCDDEDVEGANEGLEPTFLEKRLAALSFEDSKDFDAKAGGGGLIVEDYIETHRESEHTFDVAVKAGDESAMTAVPDEAAAIAKLWLVQARYAIEWRNYYGYQDQAQYEGGHAHYQNNAYDYSATTADGALGEHLPPADDNFFDLYDVQHSWDDDEVGAPTYQEYEGSVQVLDGAYYNDGHADYNDQQASRNGATADVNVLGEDYAYGYGGYAIDNTNAHDVAGWPNEADERERRDSAPQQDLVPPQRILRIVRSIATFVSTDDTELGFDVDTLIAVTNEDGSGWWYGFAIPTDFHANGADGLHREYKAPDEKSDGARNCETSHKIPSSNPTETKLGWFPCTYVESLEQSDRA